MSFYLLVMLFPILLFAGLLLIGFVYALTGNTAIDLFATLFRRGAKLTCWHCGQETAADQKTCRHCGQELQ